jgi:hypothetical protein
MEVKIFVSDYEFSSDDETMLHLSSGDEVEVLAAEGHDWWYGRLVHTGKEGWFPPTYGHLTLTTHALIETFPNSAMVSFSNIYTHYISLIQNFIQKEHFFIQQLKVFIDQVILPIEYQDTNFKRILLSEPSIALSFSLYIKIWNICSISLIALEQAMNESDKVIKKEIEANSSPEISLHYLASYFIQFAPSLRLFGQYITDNSKVLNCIKSHGKSFNQFLEEARLPIDTSIESFLILPVDHYPHYLSCLDTILYLSTGLMIESQREEEMENGLSSIRVQCDNQESLQQFDENGIQDLREALEVLQSYTNEVDDKLMNESRKHILLAVETQCQSSLSLSLPHLSPSPSLPQLSTTPRSSIQIVSTSPKAN